jgi:carboxyl-terminal processing protease
MFRTFYKERLLIFILLLILLGFISGSISPVVSALPTQTYERLRIFTEAIETIEKNYVEEVDAESILYGAIRGMLTTLDPHSSFMTPEEYKEMQVETKGQFGGLGIEISIRDDILTVVSPIEDTPAFEAGIKAGDKIVKIEDKITKGMNILEAVKLLRGPSGSQVNIWIMREGFKEPMEFTITRDIIEVKSVKSRLLEKGFGYVRIAQFQANSHSELEKALKKLATDKKDFKGLILDLRNNPGGLLNQAVSISDEFLESGLIVYTEGRVAGQEMRFEAKKRGSQPSYPIIVLVNGGSASASEIVAGALQDHERAVIVGTPTFGKGSVQTIIPLPDGSAVRITTAKYYTPSGRSIQAKGIEPDLLVKEGVIEEDEPTRTIIKEKDLEGHLSGEGAAAAEEEEEGNDENDFQEIKDVQLKRALEYLKSWYIFKGTSLNLTQNRI